MMKRRLTDQQGGDEEKADRPDKADRPAGGGLMKIRLTDQQGVGGSDEEKADKPAGGGGE